MASTITQFTHLKIPLEDVLKATNNFANKNIIGKGGFGNVYKGLLIHNGESTKISARRLDHKHGQGDVEFWTEISVLSGLDSEDVISMIGFCDEKGEKVIINHYYAKGSLSTYLSDPTFTWNNRLYIAYRVAAAVKYIHDVVGQSYFLIHRNINSYTILLDQNWNPKLSGFEFSIKQSIDRKNHVFLSEPIGTRGYMDPTIEKNGGVTFKSDIYSLGVVLFEIICGRKANKDGRLLAPLAKYHYEKGTLKDIVHPDLWNQMNLKILRCFSDVAKRAYSCLNEDEEVLRPSASLVSSEFFEAWMLLFTITEEDQFEDHANEVCEEEDEEVDFGVNISSSDVWKVKMLEHLRIELRDIKLATNNFSKTSEIENTEHYILYKAELRCFDRDYLSLVKGKNKDELPKRDYNVKIKRIHSEYYSFDKEIESLSHCNHHNIESLLGFCEEGSKMVLVYEYVSTKYLSSYLDTLILTWEKRLKICTDVAHALRYLHNEIEDQTVVIHHDIRCEKIVLDDDWRAKISGFEHSVLLPVNHDDDTLHLGEPNCVVTDLHMDPENAKIVKLKIESDVYSFGYVMLAILSGQSFRYPTLEECDEYERLAVPAQSEFKENIVRNLIAPTIMEENSENKLFLHKGPNKDSLDIFIEIISWCIEGKQTQRPTMEVIIKELGKALAIHEDSKNAYRMSFQDIKMATQDFRNEIGGGGFGRVYKGEFANGQDNQHQTIVAKKLDRSHGQGEIQFYNELEILHVYKHENIIGLVGYNEETDEKLIVYEYAARGSLDKHLKFASLTWRNRLKICIDAATGLDFLHGGVGGQVVIHRDIKAANILVFDDWKAKLGDFGLSLISAIDKETNYVIDHPCGTESYVDPLYLKSGLLTLESDVYSFGVVLFEILCGRATYTIPKPKGVSLLSFIKHNFEEEKHDGMVFKAIKEEIVPKSLTTFLNIIYKCLNDDREKRPTSKEVLAELKKTLEFQVSYHNST